MGILPYGAGLQPTECLRLRVKGADFGYRQLMVCHGKGQKDRATIPSHLCFLYGFDREGDRFCR